VFGKMQVPPFVQSGEHTAVKQIQEVNEHNKKTILPYQTTQRYINGRLSSGL